MLPKFSIESYCLLLEKLLIQYTPKLIKDFNGTEHNTLFIRHDIDYFVGDWEDFPLIEKNLGIQATYYFLLNDYNLITKRCKDYIDEILNCDHDIGLHIDLMQDKYDKEYFETEIKILEAFTGKKITTVSCHSPYKTGKIPFSLENYIDPFSDTMLTKVKYISESARAWRDCDILNTQNYDNLLFATHPEVWLNAKIINRIDYLYNFIKTKRKILHGNLDNWTKKWIENYINHTGAKAHDKREAD